MPDTQYFTNIDGKYVKDAEARQQLNDLEDYVESLDQPWQPLQDGYSNFWFELTEDTLSPWLNFSAKTESAVIDWGDGSGEVALDTLTPTHTYSKAGKYVVKVKGVTGIVSRIASILENTYLDALIAIELNSEVVTISNNCFSGESGLQYAFIYNSYTGANHFTYTPLKKIIQHTPITTVGGFYMCFYLKEYDFTSATEINSAGFQYCRSLNKVILPPTIQSLGNGAFGQCARLTEVHCQAITPPTIGTNAFISLPTDFIIYVPVGYAETYKAASGWSTYADHILEEGQTPNRMMLAKFNEETDEPQDDMR
jgi:hypothetical protein